MLEKGTIIVNEYYDENEYINEGVLETLGLRKPKSRWQRFKDAIGRNKGKVAAGVGLAGLGGLAYWASPKEKVVGSATKKGAAYEYDPNTKKWYRVDEKYTKVKYV